MIGSQILRANWAGFGIAYQEISGASGAFYPELVDLRAALEGWADRFRMRDLLEEVCYVLAWWAERPERATSIEWLLPPSVDAVRFTPAFEVDPIAIRYSPDSETRSQFIARAKATLEQAAKRLDAYADQVEAAILGVPPPEIRERGGKTIEDRMRWLALTHCMGVSERSLSREGDGESGIGRAALAEALDATADLVGIERHRLPAAKTGKYIDHAG